MLWRELGLMLAVFLPLCLLGLLVALILKPSYTAHASLLMRLGQEYVYEPKAGDAARGAIPDVDQVIQSEVEILGSEVVRNRVLQRLGLAVVAPAAVKKFQESEPDERESLLRETAQGMSKSLEIEMAPETAVVRVSYKGDDGPTSARILNAILEEYLLYRRSVLADGTTNPLQRQRTAFEDRLAVADDAYSQFLRNNNIGDFGAQKSALAQLQAQLEAQQYQNALQLNDRQTRLTKLGGDVRRIPGEVSLYHDISATPGERLAGLRAEREALLSRYRPEAQPVKDLDVQIGRLEQAISSGRTQTESVRRIGINPISQTIETERLQAETEATALRSNQSAIEAQLAEVVDRLQQMTVLEPEFIALSRERELLQATVREYTLKVQQAEAANAISDETVDNIRIVSRAQPQAKPTSLRLPVLALSILFAGFTALSVGLIRMFMRPGLQTPASASRTLGLPVLGSAGIKQ